MKKVCSKNFNSKGVMALEALLGTILSVIALVMIFYVFSNAFLQTNDNQKIAQQNAKSINDFINYFSNDEFGSISNCYGMLKLENLENFQGPDKDNLYIYVIKNNGIYLLNKNVLDSIEEASEKEEYINNLNKAYVKFERNLEIYIDETDQGSIFSAYGSGSYDEKLELKKIEYLTLEPYYGFFEDSGTGYNQNKFKITYNNQVKTSGRHTATRSTNNIFTEIDGRYLVYNNDRNILFVSKKGISEVFVFQELCSLKQLNENTRQFFYEKRNGRNLDYINNNIIFKFKKDDGAYSSVWFKWENGPICMLNNNKVNCANYLSNEYETYKDFIIAMENYVLFSTGVELTDVKLEISFEELNLDQIQKSDYEFYLDTMFYDVFIPISDKEMNPIDVTKLINSEKKELGFYDMAKWGGMNNIKINGCEEDLCNDIYYKDRRFYFYLKSDGIRSSWTKQTEIINPGFYTFKENFLRKEYDKEGNHKIFFNGKEVNSIKKIEVDAYGANLENNKFVYIINLDFDLEPRENSESKKLNYDIILSSIQYTQIPEFKN